MIKIVTPQQPNRISRSKPSDIRIIVSKSVVMESGFVVKVLALKADRLMDGFFGFCVFVRAYLELRILNLERVPPRFVGRRPFDLTAVVAEFSGRS